MTDAIWAAAVCKRDAGSDLGDGIDPHRPPVHIQRPWRDAQRDEGVGLSWVEKIHRREHADDRIRLVVEGDGATDDTGVTAKVAQPEGVREDHGPRARRQDLLRREESAEQRPDVEDASVRVVGANHPQLLGPLQALERHGAGRDPGHLSERRHRALVVEEVGIGQRAAVVAAYRHTQLDDAIGIGKGQWPKQYGVDDAEDRGRCADAKDHRQDNREGAERRPAREARRVRQIGNQILPHRITGGVGFAPPIETAAQEGSSEWRTSRRYQPRASRSP